MVKIIKHINRHNINCKTCNVKNITFDSYITSHYEHDVRIIQKPKYFFLDMLFSFGLGIIGLMLITNFIILPELNKIMELCNNIVRSVTL